MDSAAPVPSYPTAALAPDCGSGEDTSAGECTFLLNSQSIEALAFRVDVVSHRDGALLARCFVEPQTLQVGGSLHHEWRRRRRQRQHAQGGVAHVGKAGGAALCGWVEWCGSCA